MVPALINEDYVIRFAVCAQNATDDDIIYAWNVISEISSEVITACDAQEEQEMAQQLEIMSSLSEEEETVTEDVTVIVGSPKANGNGTAAALNGGGHDKDNVKEAKEGPTEDEEEVFLYDNNIPSLPTLPSAYDQVKRNGPKPYQRRNLLVRMVSDPRCYSPRIVRSFRPRDEQRRTSDSRPGSETFVPDQNVNKN